MAKKTSYLTELIERHERWKAEGGERIEEEEPHPDVMEMYVQVFHSTLGPLLTTNISTRNGNGEAEDLWDFGTVRHSGRTIGRSSIKVSGPPLTWENDDLPRHRGSDGSDESVQVRRGHASFSTSSSVTAKGDLPPIPSSTPSSPSKQRFEQDTVRHAPAQNITSNRGQPVAPDYAIPQENHKSIQRGTSDEYEDYDDQYVDTYSAKTGVVQQKMADMHLEEDLPDTTMLDSVVLPAIASVSNCCWITVAFLIQGIL